MAEDRYLCQWCGRDAGWSEWWTAGGLDGPARCPGCQEPQDGQTELLEGD